MVPCGFGGSRAREVLSVTRGPIASSNAESWREISLVMIAWKRKELAHSEGLERWTCLAELDYRGTVKKV